MVRVLLLSNSDPVSRKVAHCLDAGGIELDLMVGKWSPLAASRYVRKVSTVGFPSGTAPTLEFVDTVNRYVADNRIDCVLAGDVASELLLYNFKSSLKGAACFPLSPNATLSLFNDKHKFNKFLVANGLPAPKSILIENKDDVFADEVRELPFPVIAKPLDLEAGTGVFKADSFDHLVDHILGNSAYSDPPKLIQKYEAGLDGGCSVLARRGEILAWVLQYYARDGTIRFYRDDELLEAIRKIVRLTDFTGVATFDVRIDENLKLRAIVECNPRFWFSIPAATAHGINFVKAGIDLALGAGLEGDLQSGYREGTYVPVRVALKFAAGRLLGKKFSLGRENRRELFREIADIIPFMYMYFQNLLDRR